jgi:nucleotide-binding universal stress UspA family protein
MDITTVYVPLDGSERAERALRPAVALAERCNAELVLLAALRPEERASTVEHYLDARAAFCDREARPWLVLDCSPADAIGRAAATPGALVCMTTRGRGALRGAVLGSVGEAVVRAAIRPVVLVGPSCSSRWRMGSHPLVIAGFDGSAHSRAAAWDARDLATALHGRVRVLEALRTSDVTAAGAFPDQDAQALLQIVTQLRQGGLRAESDLVDAFDPAVALARDAQDRDAAFLAVASHGRSGVARAVLGSVAVSTVHKAPCPVLVRGPAVQDPTDAST